MNIDGPVEVARLSAPGLQGIVDEDARPLPAAFGKIRVEFDGTPDAAH